MDFEFAAEHESFRKEFRDWLATNLPPDLCLDDASDDRVASDRETFERRRVWQRKMHAAGWVAITWPKEYGGRDAGLIERVIWQASGRAPSTRATTSSSTARRCGRRARTSPTGSSCSSERIPTRRSTRGS